MSRLWPAGTLRVPAGTCPGCARPSHPGLTCHDRTTAEVTDVLRRVPGVTYIPYSPRDDVRR